MAAPNIISGARCKLGFIDGNGNANYVGIFSQVSLGLTYGVQPAYVLGRYGPASLEFTDQSPVQVNVSGWRVFGHGPHADGKIPLLKDLITFPSLVMVVVDRLHLDRPLHTISEIKPTGYTTTLSARDLESVQHSYLGIYVEDETSFANGGNVERADASRLPPEG